METSSSRPYFALFAIVAILVAAFILKQEYATAQGVTNPEASSDPGMQLHETAEHWFARVGWQKLGFKSKEQSDETLKLFEVKRLTNPSPDQKRLLHELMAEKGVPQSTAIGFIERFRDPQTEKEFLPDAAALYDPNGGNSEIRSILASWMDSPEGRDVVKTLEKDKNKQLAAFVSKFIYDHDNPSGNIMGGG